MKLLVTLPKSAVDFDLLSCYNYCIRPHWYSFRKYCMPWRNMTPCSTECSSLWSWATYMVFFNALETYLRWLRWGSMIFCLLEIDLIKLIGIVILAPVSIYHIFHLSLVIVVNAFILPVLYVFCCCCFDTLLSSRRQNKEEWNVAYWDYRVLERH